MTIQYLEDGIRKAKEQLASSSMPISTRSHNSELAAYNRATEEFVKIERDCFGKKGQIKEDKKEEGIQRIRTIMEDGIKESSKVVDALQKAMQDFPTRKVERDVRYVGDNGRVIVSTRLERDGSAKSCEFQYVKWNSMTGTSETVFDTSSADYKRNKPQDYDAPNGKNYHIWETREPPGAWSKEITSARCVIDPGPVTGAGRLPGMEEFWICTNGEFTIWLKNPEDPQDRHGTEYKLSKGGVIAIPEGWHFQFKNQVPVEILHLNIPGWSDSQVFESVQNHWDPKGKPINPYSVRREKR
jgi:mannose-6-phosphate isomerase-like protein (cupin superfamily)